MEENINFKKHFASKIDVKMYTHEECVEKRLLRGRVLLDSDDGSLLFAQDARGLSS